MGQCEKDDITVLNSTKQEVSMWDRAIESKIFGVALYNNKTRKTKAKQLLCGVTNVSVTNFGFHLTRSDGSKLEWNVDKVCMTEKQILLLFFCLCILFFLLL